MEPHHDELRLTERHTGGCLCGGVQYVVQGALREIIACHCSQCRRTSGHHAAMTRAPTAALDVSAATTLTWYRSSPTAERGFCRTCGSNLFWHEIGSENTCITAGTLDTPTGLAIVQHIFADDKSDYYQLDDDVPKRRAW